MECTKGDWKVVHEFNVEADNHRGIASCGFSNNMRVEETHRENVANAQLIASAPDLYEACQFALDVLLIDGDKENAKFWLKQALDKAGD